MRSEKILDKLDQSKGYDTALFTTFCFEVGFFERAVCSRLWGNNIHNISLFVDAKELAKAVNERGDSSLGKRYSVNPVVMNGSFHPKMILLLGKKKARLIIGSANLKMTSYRINNEVFNYIDYDENHTEYRDVICAAISFFHDLYEDAEHTYQLDDSIKKNMLDRVYYRTVADNGNLWLVHSLKRSVLDQVQELINTPVEDIKVAVPYYDNELAALHEIQNAFPDAKIQLYIQQKMSTFPEKKHAAKPCADRLNVFDEIAFSDEENRTKRNKRFYHGKVFLFKTKQDSYVLYGSSNCTKSALTRTIADGNVESNLLVKGSKDEWDAFFDGFIEAKEPGVQSGLMTFENGISNKVFFMYGTVNKETLLHVGYHNKPKNIRCFYYDEPLVWHEEKGHLVIKRDSFDTAVFEIRIEYDGGSEAVRCWANDPKELQLFRLSDNKERKLVDRDDFGIGDKFKEDYELLFRLDATTPEELAEEERIRRLVEQSADGINNDAAEADEEDYIVYVTIEDRDYSKYLQIREADSVKSRIRERFLNNLRIPISYSDRESLHNPSLNKQPYEEDHEISHRAPTTAEKRLERTAKNKIKGILTKSVVERTSYQRYFEKVTYALEVITKDRTKDQLSEEIFPDTYVIPTRKDLLINLIEKSRETESTDDLIKLVLGAILDSHDKIERVVNDQDKGYLERENTRLLKKLNDVCNIRSSYKEYFLQFEKDTEDKEYSPRLEGAERYIEKLFGYKSTEQIEKYLYKHFGDDSRIEIDDTKAKIVVNVEDPWMLNWPDRWLMKEMLNYSTRVRKLKTIIMIVNGTGAKNISKIEHFINMDYNRLTRKIYRKSGKIEEESFGQYHF